MRQEARWNGWHPWDESISVASNERSLSRFVTREGTEVREMRKHNLIY